MRHLQLSRADEVGLKQAVNVVVCFLCVLFAAAMPRSTFVISNSIQSINSIQFGLVAPEACRQLPHLRHLVKSSKSMLCSPGLAWSGLVEAHGSQTLPHDGWVDTAAVGAVGSTTLLLVLNPSCVLSWVLWWWDGSRLDQRSLATDTLD